MSISSGDSVTFEYTARLPDGPVFDTTREQVAEESGLAERRPDLDYRPFTVEIGAGEILEGVEEALIGMEQQEEATVKIPPEKGYGERSEENVQSIDTGEFEQMLGGETPEEGMQIRTQEGGVAKIVHAGPETVRVDFNHELAGQTLEFDIEVVEVN